MKKIKVQVANKWEEFRDKKISDVTDEMLSDLRDMWDSVEEHSGPLYSSPARVWTDSDFELADKCLAVQRILTTTERFLANVERLKDADRVAVKVQLALQEALAEE